MGRGSCFDLKGIESLPVFLLVTATLSTLVVGTGVRMVEIFDEKRDEQISLDEFQKFVEKARSVCYGLGEVQVTLSKAEILLDGKFAKLLSPPRVESLPISFFERLVLKRGTYTIRLRKDGGGWFLEVK
jgi:hypothetical protein